MSSEFKNTLKLMTKSELKAMKRTLESDFLYTLHSQLILHREFKARAIELLAEEIYNRRTKDEA